MTSVILNLFKSKAAKTGSTSLVAVAIILSLAAIQGCQSALPAVIGPSVGYYCTLPEKARELVRLGIDSRTLPNKVRIECYGETQE